MAGTTDRKLMTVADAKSQLREYAQRTGAPSGPHVSPLLRIGAALIAGACLGHRLRRPRADRAAGPIVGMIGRAATAAMPLVVPALMRAMMDRAGSRTADRGASPGHTPEVRA